MCERESHVRACSAPEGARTSRSCGAGDAPIDSPFVSPMACMQGRITGLGALIRVAAQGECEPWGRLIITPLRVPLSRIAFSPMPADSRCQKHQVTAYIDEQTNASPFFNREE